jgi:hypothetical protein
LQNPSPGHAAASQVNETIPSQGRVSDRHRQPIADGVYLRRDSGAKIKIATVFKDCPSLTHRGVGLVASLCMAALGVDVSGAMFF